MNNRLISFLSYSLSCLLLLACGATYARPDIKWTPSKLDIEQMQGTAATYHLSIETAEDIEGLVAIVVPELQSWIRVSPASIGHLSGGQSIDITIDVNVSPDEDIGSFDGTIQLKQSRAGKPYKTIAKPLPIKLNIIEFIGGELPPDPGEYGKQTLLGVDIDADGVRDDIQRYIHITYPNDNLVRLALKEYAKQFQLLLTNPSDRNAAYNNATKMLRHRECLSYLKGEEANAILDEIRAEILNTRERSIAYIDYSDSLGGQILYFKPLSDWKNSCAFNVDAVGGEL